MAKKYKFQYWTLIKKISVGDKKLVGQVISFRDKREYFTFMNIRTGKTSLQGEGIYLGRTPTEWKDKQKFDFLEKKMKEKGLK